MANAKAKREGWQQSHEKIRKDLHLYAVEERGQHN